MTKEKTQSKVKVKKEDGGGIVYCMGVIGAAVFYIQQADSFWMGALGILKALLWPAFLVYELLKSVV